MSRRILVTNDDGIDSDGIHLLAKTAMQFGEVTVVAPDTQRSAASHHCIFSKPLTLKRYDFGIDGIDAYSLDGTPADCARIGILAVMDRKPDIVLSGVNHGYNIASDVQYSGTIGAALEATIHGVQGIAVSMGMTIGLDVVEHYLPSLLEEYISKPLPRDKVWNINFPECTLKECKGVLRDVSVHMKDFYGDICTKEPVDDNTWTIRNTARRIWEAPEGTDLYAIINNYVSVGTVSNLS